MENATDKKKKTFKDISKKLKFKLKKVTLEHYTDDLYNVWLNEKNYELVHQGAELFVKKCMESDDYPISFNFIDIGTERKHKSLKDFCVLWHSHDESVVYRDSKYTIAFQFKQQRADSTKFSVVIVDIKEE